jgi:tRNA-Thr(GGU) m(6)t(6)A37 methyltransferase TsaA
MGFRIHPVGRIEIQGAHPRIRILEPFIDALLGLEQWSHIDVLYWFDRNDTPARRRILRVHPRGDRENPLTGVFACRAPVRPNPIALTVCRILSVEGGAVTVDRIDALDGTPVLDLKPLIPPDFSVEDLRVPRWAGGKRKSARV